MKITLPIVVLGIALQAGGCSSDSQTPPASETGAQDATATVFDPMVQTLDRAREAEDKVAEHAAELRARIDGLEADED